MFTEELKQKFITIVGENNFQDSRTSLLTYSYDATPGFQSFPDAILSPRNTEEVSNIVKLCNENNIPITPRGSGTNLSAGTTPLHGGVVILMKHFDNILEIDEENLTVRTQPGVITKTLIEAVEERGSSIHQTLVL